MLTIAQTKHLKAYTCPLCEKPLGRFHCYPVTTDTLLSRLTETVPMHYDCAASAAPTLFAASKDVVHYAIIYVVKSSSPNAPSARLFERLPQDWQLHLQTPIRIEFYVPDDPREMHFTTKTMRRPNYDQTRQLLLPAIRRAAEAATSDEEIDEIARAIAALHHFLPAKD